VDYQLLSYPQLTPSNNSHTHQTCVQGRTSLSAWLPQDHWLLLLLAIFTRVAALLALLLMVQLVHCMMHTLVLSTKSREAPTVQPLTSPLCLLVVFQMLLPRILSAKALPVSLASSTISLAVRTTFTRLLRVLSVDLMSMEMTTWPVLSVHQ